MNIYKTDENEQYVHNIHFFQIMNYKITDFKENVIVSINYVKEPKGSIFENYLALSYLALELFRFFETLLRGMISKGESDKNAPQMKICALDKLQIYAKFPISIFNSKSFHLKRIEYP